ncbi:MAG: bifunctional methylenetetrahydrofolate dehydrogenase/methenyltetrahydrofolate cyclohydrolase FolD [Gammaproteobacteria bacterium]|nr:bifunctional methylenetetrahydrofolate dehydrogenase/methenyltetrahydrofolate cyclohydrolase FolD [Gammaproteobacteria bacterium]
MTAKIINGKEIASAIKNEIQSLIDERIDNNKTQPGLAVILIGNNPASNVYVNHKIKSCDQTGILSKTFRKPEDTSEAELLALIDELNNNKAIHGILVQLPLPRQINADHIIEAIDPSKDVDGFHPYNVGRLVIRNPTLRPCTPFGVIQLLKATGKELKGLKATVLGSSNIVGRPMALELLLAGVTPTLTNRYTPEHEIINSTLHSDIIVVALGRPNYLRGEWIKPGAIVIDVGINRMSDGSLTGDVDFQSAEQTAGWITPVPGGVGPMTVAMLMRNTLQACEAIDG